MNYAFTLDDLPVWPMSYPPAGYSVQSIVDRIISALDAHQIRGVFAFANSWSIVKHPEFKPTLDKWVAAGHQVANHTHSHIEFNDTPSHAYIEDIELGEKHLHTWMSKAPAKYFRHPLCHWGNTAEKVNLPRTYLDKHHYRTVEVTSWFYEWWWNRAYLNCLEKGDSEGTAFIRRSFLEFCLAQLRYDDVCARRWFGRDITGIAVGHTLPFFADIADEFFGFLVENGVTFVPLSKAIEDPAYRDVASVPTKEFLVYHQKLAHASGKPIAMVDPGQQEIFDRIKHMSAGRNDQ